MPSYQGNLSIANIAIFTPLAYLSLLLALRHGWGSNAAWIFLVLFTLTRVTGETLQLAATEFFPASAPNTSLGTGSAILNEISLTPLLMATVSLLSRLYTPKGRRMAWILSFIGVPVLISLALIVAGGIDPESREGPTFASDGPIRAGMVIYLVCYLIVVWCTGTIGLRIMKAELWEWWILGTVTLSLPSLAVRVSYSMAFAYEDLWGSQRFNVISGSSTLQLAMQVIQEYIVCILYVGVGIKITRLNGVVGDEEMLNRAAVVDGETINEHDRRMDLLTRKSREGLDEEERKSSRWAKIGRWTPFVHFCVP